MGDFAEAAQLGGKERITTWELKREQGTQAVFWNKLIEPSAGKESLLLIFSPSSLLLFMQEQQNLTSFF